MIAWFILKPGLQNTGLELTAHQPLSSSVFLATRVAVDRRFFSLITHLLERKVMSHHLEEMHLLLKGKNNLVCTGSLALRLASTDSTLPLFPSRDQMNPTLDFPNSSFQPSSIIPCLSFTAWGWVFGAGKLKKNKESYGQKEIFTEERSRK